MEKIKFEYGEKSKQKSLFGISSLWSLKEQNNPALMTLMDESQLTRL